MPLKDKEKRREYDRLRRIKNIERKNETDRLWKEKNREKVNARERLRQRNPDVLERKRNWAREQRRTNPETKAIDLKNQRAQRLRIKTWVDELKANLACPCGENHPACLDFHHRDPNEKEDRIANMVGKRCSKERILAEIAKCDVLCANCHRKLHHNLLNPTTPAATVGEAA